MVSRAKVKKHPRSQLVIAVSSRAMFNLDRENQIFETRPEQEYVRYQQEHEEELLQPGPAFPMVKALLEINKRFKEPLIEIILISQNDPDTSIRVFRSMGSYKLKIERAAFVTGGDAYAYLESFSANLFLSANDDQVSQALRHHFPAAKVWPVPSSRGLASSEGRDDGKVRIAFDGDSVLFGGETDAVFEKKGLPGAQRYEELLQHVPLRPGPLKGFLVALHQIQQKFPRNECPIRTALITARSTFLLKRPIRTFRAWKVRVDEAFFLGGMTKQKVLQVFRPHIFFDDKPENFKGWQGAQPLNPKRSPHA
jgi:5'-nucleotidase